MAEVKADKEPVAEAKAEAAADAAAAALAKEPKAKADRLSADVKARAGAQAARAAQSSTEAPENEPGTNVEHGGQEHWVDVSLVLAKFDSELLVNLAETLGNPLALQPQRRT